MTINIADTIAANLNFPPLQKIDPDTQEVKNDDDLSHDDFAQAAIPALLTGLYKFSKTEEGNVEILKGELSGNLLNNIFGETTGSVVDKIAGYTGNSSESTAEKMENIARESVKVIRDSLSNEPSGTDVKKFLNDQRHNILVYLPPALHMGEILDDNTIDDRTNKMEGPVSGIMHSIGEIFASSGDDEKKEENF